MSLGVNFHLDEMSWPKSLYELNQFHPTVTAYKNPLQPKSGD